jgi:hypothetical protein
MSSIFASLFINGERNRGEHGETDREQGNGRNREGEGEGKGNERNREGTEEWGE